jgi:putative membrane protein (TIGR04086 family)
MIKQSNQALASTLNDHNNLMSILRGIIVSYIITIPTFIIFSFILTYTNFPEKYILPVVVITTVISILMAGSTVTRSVKDKGWLNGGIVGFIYVFVLYIVSSLIYGNFAINRYVITMVIIGILVGAIGGIVGINIGLSSHYKHRRKL